MVFNSLEFLVFLPIVFLVHWLVFKGRTGRNAFLLLASYVFYGWWNPMFLTLIFATTLISYLCGQAVAPGGRLTRKAANLVFYACVIANLGILGVYKYFDFFARSFATLLRGFGMEADDVTLNLILPVGISFYTFQALGYVIDVRRGVLLPTRQPVAFFAFISFFPQLVAGPIERATNLLPQFQRNRRFDYAQAVGGMRLILWGLFKKIVVADSCALAVDQVFNTYFTSGSLNLWIAAFLFTIQIYCDFSGYSDMAIGVARLFGIRLMRNFNLPYFARNINEFWQRWHISLTTWFRDYVYIPLGGNRCSRFRHMRNIMMVFLTSGLWHGANFTFIAWGAYHGALYLPGALRRKRLKAAGAGKSHDVPAKRPSGLVYATLCMGLTFLLVMVGWILFRSETLVDAWQYLRLMFAGVPTTKIIGKSALLWAVVMLVAEWAGRRLSSPVDLFALGPGRHKVVRWSLYVLLFIVTLIFSESSKQFIYFQF